MPITESPRKPRIFYGWWIVTAAFFFCFIASGCGFISFSLFVSPLQTDFSWGRGEIMLAFTIYLLATGAFAPFIGRILYRYDVRKIITFGAVIFGLGLALLSRLTALWHLYLGYAVIGIAVVAIGHIPASTIVSNWFEKRRGMAIGIMSAGIGTGGFVMALLVGGYLIPNYGWETTYMTMAVITWVVVIPLALFVIRRSPSDMGLYPDGVEVDHSGRENGDKPAHDRGLSLRMALATSGFWLIALSYMAGGFSGVGVMQNQAPHLGDLGYPEGLVAATVGGAGLFSVVGMISFGWLCDRIKAKYTYAIAVVFQMAAVITLFSIKADSPVMVVWLYVVLMGLGSGGWLPTMSINVSRNFGLAHYGLIFGVISVAQSIGIATGPLMAGYIFDNRGSYYWAFVIALVMLAVALLSILLVRRPKSFP